MQTRSKKRIGFICTHVAEQGAPVCLIEHSEPIDEIDSGWGIYCGAAEHSNDELRITDLERFTGLDSDLAGCLQAHLKEASPGGVLETRRG